MQMSRITNDITVYWSNVALWHVPVDGAVAEAFETVAVRIHDISVLHT